MPQPMKQLDPGASPQEWFGSELRRLRLEQGLSAKALGRLVQVSDDMILSIEKGKYPSCRRDVVQRLDDALGTGGLLDRAWPMVFGGGDADKKRADADKSPPRRGEVRVQAPAGRILGRDEPTLRPGSHEPVIRRSFLGIGGLAAIAPLSFTDAFAPAELSLPSHVNPSHVDQVLAVSNALSGMDNELGGGGVVRDVAARAMQWSAGLLQAQFPEHLRTDLFAAVSRLGIVVGASAFDAYHHDEATKTFRFAADCAEEAGDWHLRAKTYSFLARQAVWIGAPDDGLTYAEKGLVRSDRLTATEQAMLHTARARAFGKMGNVRDTMAAVGAADEAFTRARPAEDPSWMAYYDEAQHNGDTAHALFDLAILAGQDPGRAARRFNTAVNGHADAYKRSRAISRTKLASLLMAKGDPRQAAALGHEALNEVGRLTSRRAADDLRQLGRFASEHRTVQEASALRDRIAATVSA
ncbi:helix-turn-helix domain-containing protein [Streptomyces sp. SID685]|nr:helix-turn-helix domain-containing protein [Streptomyces sp. SID685]